MLRLQCTNIGLAHSVRRGGKQLTPAMLAARFRSLYALLREPALYGKDCCGEGTRESPYLIGPDVTKAGFTTSGHASDRQKPWAVEFLSELAELAVPLDILTWHHYYATGGSKPVTPAEFTSESFLNKFLQVASQASVTFKQYGSGATNVPYHPSPHPVNLSRDARTSLNSSSCAYV